MKKSASVALAVMSTLVFCGCSQDQSLTTTEPEMVGFEADALIGVAMPQKGPEGWYMPEGLFNYYLSEAGFRVQFSTADGGVPEQQNQIESMIEDGVRVIVVDAIDGSQLGAQLAKAKAAGIAIIAYDRLLINTTDVDLYIAYDRCQVGRLQAAALLEGLDKKGTGSFNIELIAGSPDDANSVPFFDCAMEVLQPRIDSGDLVIPLGQISREQVSTVGWDPTNVQTRFEGILSSFYADGTKLDGVLSPNDTLARAAITSVLEVGLENPVVTGQDSEVESIKWIAEGKQYSTINRDMETLVTEVIRVIQILQRGEASPINDSATFDNGAKVVPAYLLAPVLVTKDNLCTAYSPNTTAAQVAASTSLCQD